MATTLSPGARRSPVSLLLVAGVAAFIALAAFTASAVWRAFEDRSGQARAASVFDLVATRTAVRPTNAPGAIAWLTSAHGLSGLSDRSLADPSESVPESLAGLANILRSESQTDGLGEAVLAPTADVPGGVRSQRLVQVGAHTLVLTRRRA